MSGSVHISQDNLKDFIFGELSAVERRNVESHVSACPECSEELHSLSLTRTALLALAEEEPPRRIAFVSDKVLEPRWWNRIWHSGPKLGFVSACVLALAIVVHAFQAPGAPPQTVTATSIDAQKLDAEVSKRVAAAVEQAVASAEDRQAAKILDVVNARLKLSERQYQSDLIAVQEYVVRAYKVNANVRRAAFEEPGVVQ
jgi:anti-sigma factor RsiW